MLTWCRACRVWTLADSDHRGCDRQGLRYHPSNPLCGDIWLLDNGLIILVDFVDSFASGFTASDGSSFGFRYTCGAETFLRDHAAKLLSTWEEWPFAAACDLHGWTRYTYGSPPILAESLDFLRRRLRVLNILI